MWFDLTKTDIKSGVRDSCDMCPTALCINETLKNAGYPTVTSRCTEYEICFVHSRDGNTVVTPTQIGCLPTPPSVKYFIQTFDNSVFLGDLLLPPEPFEFELDVEPLLEKISGGKS